MMRNATVRQLEIISEAAARLTDGIKSSNPDIDWEAIIGFRNIIVHEYFGINYEIVWNTIKNDLDMLELHISKILAAI
ncbi:MAG: putative Nucleotidyltransferase [Ignavibacteria bacterium]|nr:putative Nucleotidyltransferase [Ignavibacteria bacterium]